MSEEVERKFKDENEKKAEKIALKTGHPVKLVYFLEARIDLASDCTSGKAARAASALL